MSSTVTVANAKAALMNFRRQQFDVSPEDAEHIQAYVSLRETCNRVGGRMLLSYLESRRQEVSHGEAGELIYWAVPRVNFPRGLPANIAAKEKDPERLGPIRGFSAEEFWIIDQSIQRHDLGDDVWAAKTFRVNVSKGVVTPPPAATTRPRR